ncbi:universal stress protein [Candidatus Nitrosocosmicus sp. FF01]|uniref:universal stress protein n=1 Tax=Candidatus Nitrosocosmicus sp. FF01 TaxID=3397670 RepID=UPI0039EAFC1F
MSIKNDSNSNNKSDNIDFKYANKPENEINLVGNSSESIYKPRVPIFNKILVTYDGSHKSEKAINYSIYLSNISRAEIVILQIIGNIDKLENSTIDVSNKYASSESNISANTIKQQETKNQDYSVYIEGKIVKSMEDKIKEIENSGFKGKVSYKIRPGFVVDEIVKETKESKYDLLIISSSHMDSWLKSLFSETRKIISHVDLPVLLLH